MMPIALLPLLLVPCLVPVPCVLPQELAGATPRAQEPEALQLEGLDGTRRRHRLEEPLSDPRDLEAWIVRPVFQEGTPVAESAPEGGWAEVTLVGGDRILGRVVGGRGEELVLEWTSGETLRLDATRLSSLRRPDLVPARWDEPVEAPDEGDRLYVLAAGGTLDVVDGTLEEFGLEGVRFEGALGSKLFPWEEVVAVFLEEFGEEPEVAAAAGVHVVLDLVDGSRVGARLERLDAQGVHLHLVGEATSTLEWSRVAQLVVVDDRLRFLSDLEAVSEAGAGSPFDDGLGMTWPHRRDRSVVDGPLLVAGHRHPRGLGMHAPTRVTFELDGTWTTLRGSVGVDDSVLLNPSWARGELQFRVLADGRPLWESRVLRGGDLPLALPPLSLAGVQKLVLEVDPQGDFAGDRADWLGMILVR